MMKIQGHLSGLRVIWLVAISILSLGQELRGDGLQNGEFTVPINGVKQWYKVSGTGPVCLMPSPAWGMSSDLYIKTLKPMEKIFTIVYLDSRACGRSDPAPSLTQYTWADLDADLDALRAHLGQKKVWVMGHSEGAMEALHYACKHPNRINGAVLLSVGGITGKNLGRDGDAIIASREGDPKFAEALKAEKKTEEMPTNGPELTKFLQATLPLFWYDPSKMAKYDFSGGSKTSSAKISPATAMQGKNASHRGDLSDITAADYKNLTAPVLIVTGDTDFVCPLDGATRFHLALRNSKLLVIEQCGHFTWNEQAEAFNTRLPEFLQALGLRTH
jgi:proline iminopeptidase